MAHEDIGIGTKDQVCETKEKGNTVELTLELWA